MIVGSTNALNKCDLNSQHMTLSTASFFKVPIKALIFTTFACYMMDQSGHVSGNQSRGIYIHELSQFGPCLSEMFIGLISFCYSIPIYCGYLLYRYSTMNGENQLLITDDPMEFAE